MRMVAGPFQPVQPVAGAEVSHVPVGEPVQFQALRPGLLIVAKAADRRIQQADPTVGMKPLTEHVLADGNALGVQTIPGLAVQVRAPEAELTADARTHQPDLAFRAESLVAENVAADHEAVSDERGPILSV